MANKFLVIDGSSLIHRAFFALPPLMNKKGVHTGAVYGLCNMLLKLLGEVQPNYMLVAFDKSRKTFRTEMYADYKGQRKPTPSELSEQFPLAMQVLKTMGIATLELDNYEADDIIGTIADKVPQDLEVIIVTGDKDELQLIDDRTTVYYTKRGISDLQIFDQKEFADVYEGLVPKQLIELKGLMGDTSDNIPGVPGVGPKTALKLIKEYGNVKNVLANIDKISGKALKEKLQANIENALLSQKLATIYLDAPIDTDVNLYELKPLPEAARTLLQDLEFKNMYERFATVLGCEENCFSLFGEEIEKISTPLEKINNLAQAEKFFADLNKVTTPIAFYVEITGSFPDMDFAKVEFLGRDKVYIIENLAFCKNLFKLWLESSLPKQTINSKEIYKCCLCQDIAINGIVDDIALAAYVADAGQSEYTLDALSKNYLVHTSVNASENIASLVKVLRDYLADHQQISLYENLELPLAKVLAEMEYTGITPNLDLLEKLNAEMSVCINDLEMLAQTQAGEEFNLKSPKQLGVILFEKLQLPIIKKTKTGYSTDAKVLDELKDKHPLVATILEHRKLAKLKSTYLDGLKPLVNVKTKRIHTHFQQMVTVTGRLSSTDPNLQNIPARTEEGRQIRRIFVPGAGYDWLMSCDYSQVELRILACIAQDQLLLESFRHGQDVHARTAAEVFGVPLAEVSSEMRSRAKAVNFGIVYGISDFGLGNQLQVSRKEAAGYIENYFARYTGVKKYMEDSVNIAREQGYVSTLMGRRRDLPDIRNSNFNLRSFAERTAINTPIQGTAADIMKKAMIDVAQALKANNLKSRILLQVHDELVLEVTEEEKDKVAQLVQKCMENAAILEIPLLAEVNFGKNWAETK